MTPTPAPKGADIELAPCPFCGGAAQATTGFTTSSDWPHGHFDRIFCTSCQCRQLFHRTKAEAVAAWNRRSGSSTSTSQGVDIDAHPLADALYNRGYRDAQNERDYDPRAGQEWQTVVDAIEGAAPGGALDAMKQARDAVQRVAASLGVLHEDRPVEMAAIITTVALIVSDDLEQAASSINSAIATSTAQEKKS